MSDAHPQDEYYFGFWLYTRGLTYERNITEAEFRDLWKEYCKTGYQPKTVDPSKFIAFLLVAGPLVGFACGFVGLIYFLVTLLP